MEFIPIKSVDPNTMGIHLIWQCDLSQVLSKRELAKKDSVHVSIHVKTVSNNNNNNNIDKNDNMEKIKTLEIPMETQSVGLAGPYVKSHKKPSFLQQTLRQGPAAVALCLTGVNERGISKLPEFIQHHWNVGVEHFVVGVMEQDKHTTAAAATATTATTANATTITNMQRILEHPILSYYIDQGILVLGLASEGKSVIKTKEIEKLRFYNQCLYHAKGVAEYVVNWDIDEIWMPPHDQFTKIIQQQQQETAGTSGTTATATATTKTGYHTYRTKQMEQDYHWNQNQYYKNTMSLVEAARSITGENGCTDWCYQTFPSYTVQRVYPDPPQSTTTTQLQLPLQGYYGFPVRDAESNRVWQKPVIQTKYAFQSSYHIGGSCRRSNTDDESSFVPMFQHCKLVGEHRDDTYGQMHHYQTLFREGWGVVEAAKYPIQDEYTLFLRNTTLQQLQRIRDNNVKGSSGNRKRRNRNLRSL